MIKSIQHKGLKEPWVKGNPRLLPPDQVRKITLILNVLHKAHVVEDMNFPGANLHQLKGELKAFWAVTVKANWRIIFEFKNGDAFLVD